MAESVVKVRGDTSHAVRELGNLDKSLGGLNISAGLATKALAGITAAGGAVAFAIKKTMDSVDELAKTSRTLGMTAADLQAFRNSAELAGVGSDELTASLRRLQVNIGEALVKGTGPAKDALDRLGLSMQELQGLDAGQQFQKIAEEVAKISDPALRAATATQLLGRQGPRLLEAADNIERMQQQAKQLGINLSDVDTAAIERANDSITELVKIVQGFIQKLAAELAPAIIAIAERIKAVVMQMGGLDKIIRERVIPAFKIAAQVAAALVVFLTVTKLTAGVIALAKFTVIAAKSLRAAAVGALLLNKAVAVTPLGRINSLVGAVGRIAVRAAPAILGILGIKMAVDAVDDAFGGLDNDIARITAELNNIPPPLQQGADLTNVISDNIVKARQAHEKFVQGLEENIRLQQDILKLGDDEAQIRQVIRQEQEKYSGANADIIRDLLEQESILKRQIILEQEKNAELVKSLEPTSNLSKELRELERLSMKFNDNMTDKEIAAAIQAQAVAANELSMVLNGQSIATVNQENKIKELMRTEIARYDKIFALEREKARALDTFNELERNSVLLSLDEQQKLQNAKIRFLDEYNAKYKQALQQQMAAEQQANLQLQGIVVGGIKIRSVGEEEAKKIVADRQAFENKTTMEKTQFGIQQGAELFTALGAQNKKAFEAAKAFNIANAIMNTFMGATRALALPFPFNLIAAGAVIATGMAQVSQIRSQQYSGRQGGGPIAAGMPYLVGEAGPEIIRAPAGGGTVIPNHKMGGGGAVNVNFTINAIDTQGIDELLIERKSVITSIIQDAMLEQGQRF